MGGVIDLRGTGQRLGSSFASIGQSLSNILHPHRELNERVRQSIVADPDMLKRLGNLERETPGTLRELNLDDDIIQQAKSTPETLQNIIDRQRIKSVTDMIETKPDQVSQLLGSAVFGMTPTEFAKETTFAPIFESLVQRFPQLAETAVGDLIRGRTKEEETIAQTAAERSLRERDALQTVPDEAFQFGERARARGGATDFDIKLNEFRDNLLTSANTFVQNAAAREPNKFGKQAARVFASELFSDEDARIRFEQQMQLLLARTSTDYKGFEQELIRRQAIESFQATNVGTVEAWEKVLVDPSRSLQLLRGNIQPIDENDQQMLEIARSRQSMALRDKAKIFAENHRQFLLVTENILDSSSPSSLQAAELQTLNRLLEDAAILTGGPVIKAFIDQKPFGAISLLPDVIQPKTLLFRDGAGNFVDTRFVESLVSGTISQLPNENNNTPEPSNRSIELNEDEEIALGIMQRDPLQQLPFFLQSDRFNDESKKNILSRLQKADGNLLTENEINIIIRAPSGAVGNILNNILGGN